MAGDSDDDLPWIDDADATDQVDQVADSDETELVPESEVPEPRPSEPAKSFLDRPDDVRTNDADVAPVPSFLDRPSDAPVGEVAASVPSFQDRPPSDEPEPIDTASFQDRPVASSSTDEPPTDGDPFLRDGPSQLDDYSHDDYVANTTTEYEGLAASMRQRETETVELQAVAAPLAGIDSGVVGFDDVTGKTEAPIEAESGGGDLVLRIVSGLVLASLLIGSAIAGGVWFVAFIVLASIVAVGELYAATRKSGYKPVALLGLIAAIVSPIAGYVSGPGGVAGTVTVMMVAVLIFYTMLIRKDPLDNAAVTIFGIVWIPGMLGFATAIARADNSAPLIIGLVLVAAAVDIGSFFMGRTFGKTPLAPVLSPNKTWEGLAGGAVGAFGMTLIISLVDYFDTFQLPMSLVLAGAIVIVSPLGDLAESMIKRSLGIKDMGSIVPGHGGLLDRVDALLFSVPIGYFVFQSLGYLSL